MVNAKVELPITCRWSTPGASVSACGKSTTIDDDGNCYLGLFEFGVDCPYTVTKSGYKTLESTVNWPTQNGQEIRAALVPDCQYTESWHYSYDFGPFPTDEDSDGISADCDCDDTDSGNKILKADGCPEKEGEVIDCSDTTTGSVIVSYDNGSTVELHDECASSSSVNHYICQDGKSASTVMQCSSDQECENGQCVEKEVQVSCTDNDPDNDPFVKGVVTYTMLGSSTEFEDRCWDNSLQQNFCTGVSVEKTLAIDCNDHRSGYVCKDGTCIEETSDYKFDIKLTHDWELEITSVGSKTPTNNECFDVSLLIMGKSLGKDHFCGSEGTIFLPIRGDWGKHYGLDVFDALNRKLFAFVRDRNLKLLGEKEFTIDHVVYLKKLENIPNCAQTSVGCVRVFRGGREIPVKENMIIRPSDVISIPQRGYIKLEYFNGIEIESWLPASAMSLSEPLTVRELESYIGMLDIEDKAGKKGLSFLIGKIASIGGKIISFPVSVAMRFLQGGGPVTSSASPLIIKIKSSVLIEDTENGIKIYSIEGTPEIEVDGKSIDLVENTVVKYDNNELSEPEPFSPSSVETSPGADTTRETEPEVRPEGKYTAAGDKNSPSGTEQTDITWIIIIVIIIIVAVIVYSKEKDMIKGNIEKYKQ
ncbi:MAG: hypothetical protein ISS36_02465 [Candidatus Aenigmarchaeota archaeon]|nr:hypothetical protein [Candidatus Aenigmarchaeota archaeon]